MADGAGEGGGARNIVAIVVMLAVLVVGCPVGLVFTTICGLTALGSHLDQKFSEVAEQVDAAPLD